MKEVDELIIFSILLHASVTHVEISMDNGGG
jgi:hypothetical protein